MRIALRSSSFHAAIGGGASRSAEIAPCCMSRPTIVAVTDFPMLQLSSWVSWSMPSASVQPLLEASKEDAKGAAALTPLADDLALVQNDERRRVGIGVGEGRAGDRAPRAGVRGA